MSGVKYFETRQDAEWSLKAVQLEWPAASVVGAFVHDEELPKYKIAGDYACTKFLHEDGHVY
jgi:hypothetical protein